MSPFFSSLNGYSRYVRSLIWARPIISVIVGVVVLGGGYYLYTSAFGTSTQTHYVLGTVQKGTIVASVSGSGQVSTSNKIDIKPRVSGEITWVGVKAGDKVFQGQALMAIDNTDAKQAVAQAEQSLAEAELQFQHDQAAAPIDYQKSVDALATAQDDLKTEYYDAFTTLSQTYLDLPGAVTGMEDVLYGTELSAHGAQRNIDAITNLFSLVDDQQKIKTFADDAESDYKSARSSYDAALTKYKGMSRASSNADVEAFLSQSVDATTALSAALQSELNFISEAQDLGQIENKTLPATLTTLQNNAKSYLATTNSTLNTLIAERKALSNAKQAVVNDQQTLSLLKVGNDTGANPISLQIAQNNLQDKRNTLASLRTKLADYTVVAPFNGTISAVSATRGQDVSGSVATIITDQQIAQLSVNEVDAAKIKLGDKATLTFDAIDGLTLTGSVAEIDTVGTVAQGVVSYTVQIGFDSQDARIKSGMTVNASIQTATKQDVLTVPSSAVKTTNGVSHVMVFTPALSDTGGTAGVASATAPSQVEVTTGISDDTNVEIVSGLTEGQQIVVRTINGSTTTTTGTTRNATGGGAIRL